MTRIDILSERCKSCEFCLSVCRQDVLEIGEKVNEKGYRYIIVKNQDGCTGCLMCANMCPDAAIEIYR